MPSSEKRLRQSNRACPLSAHVADRPFDLNLSLGRRHRTKDCAYSEHPRQKVDRGPLQIERHPIHIPIHLLVEVRSGVSKKITANVLQDLWSRFERLVETVAQTVAIEPFRIAIQLALAKLPPVVSQGSPARPGAERAH